MRNFLFLVILSTFGCSVPTGFNYKPVKFGSYEEGYDETTFENGVNVLKIISTQNHSREVLEHFFHFRATEKCRGYNYQLIELYEMIDICADGKCFESALHGKYKCTQEAN
ncbi:hypothetical protein N480_00380 [Pseudoalteromonas luteoviolacea S2607]|uniref:hypothetical protein n=1 Tax=Pseudoalteromonas luteoviolacea TaxID=43657 RepID=UPI0007B04F35|nr:hypothetical protein [Pseudoalteromonas luteoviolacea]KZN39317.1 hypothetical protein N480_00380 [Pseudoalteromonas luteoviolacea S2607]